MPGAVGAGRRVGGLQQPDGLGAGLHRRRLAPVAAVPQHRGPGPAGPFGGVVGRAVVDHDDEVNPGQPGGAGHRGLDAVGLVPGRNDDCDVPGRSHAQILERRARGRPGRQRSAAIGR